MRRLTLIALVSFISLSAGGCNLFNQGQETLPEESNLNGVPIPDQEEAAEEFAEPLVPASPSPAAVASAELIQSTDVNERLQQIEGGQRVDPFAVLPVPPRPTPAPPPPPGGGTPAAGNTPGAPLPASPGGTAVAGSPAGGSPTTGGRPAGTPAVGTTTGGTGATPGLPGRPGGTAVGTVGGGTIAPLPQLPRTELASAVAVTGVVRIGTENYAIVQAPNEPTSRYVKAGQRLSNGQVLVKRIEVQGSSPMVVLEQNGIEISRAVGSTGEDVMEEESPAASVPVPAQAVAALN